jgi:hypothetical protein
MPTAASLQYFSAGQTIADLVVNGQNLTLYDAAMEGVVLPTSTVLTNGSTYYVTQTINNQESDALGIMVEEIDATIPVIDLRANYCNVTLGSLASNIYATSVVGADLYQFEVTNTSTNMVELINSESVFFKLIDGNTEPTLNTVYSIRVRASRNNIFGDFGNACTVSVVANPIKLRDVSCGIQLIAFNTPLYGESFAGAETFEFEITNLNTNAVTNYVSNTRNFSLSQTSAQLIINNTYQVRMRPLKNNLPMVDFGAACNVLSPTLRTQLRPSSCGVMLANMNSPIYANNVANATQFEFEVYNPISDDVETIIRNIRIFSLGMLEMDITPGTTYEVRVRAMVNGNFMPYGSICTVTTPGATEDIVSKTSETNLAWEVKSYPNPFQESLTIQISGQVALESQISWYDVSGKKLGFLTTSEQEINLGQNLVPGIYFVNVVNGNQVSNFKIIKR